MTREHWAGTAAELVELVGVLEHAKQQQADLVEELQARRERGEGDALSRMAWFVGEWDASKARIAEAEATLQSWAELHGDAFLAEAPEGAA